MKRPNQLIGAYIMMRFAIDEPKFFSNVDRFIADLTFFREQLELSGYTQEDLDAAYDEWKKSRKERTK